jgi:CubicO group peptidase (beta-lactamase class C family)
MMRRSFVVVVAATTLTLTLAGAAFAQSETDVRADARAAMEGFAKVAEQALADFNVPGSALAVVAGGKIVYAEGFGHRDLEAGKPMTPDTLFAIGSTTKAMTATLLGMLVGDGKLDFDDPLRESLPRFRLADPTISERITTRDILTHRTGLPRHDFVWYNNNEGTRAEVIERLAHLELTADLREKFQYNNLMFMTAGYLAGVLSDSTWEEALHDRLFTPLEMSRTNFSVTTSQEDDDFAYPYSENDDHQLERIPFRNIDLIGPAGSVNSSVNEMSRWLLFNLNDGKVGDEQLMSAATLADIQSPQMATGETPDRVEISQGTYGMGWGIDTYRGHRRVSHGGGIDGFITDVVLFPDDGFGLVAFNNGESGISSLLTRHAADRLLDLEPIDWLGEEKTKRDKTLEAEDEAEEKKDATRIADTTPSHPLADYAGEYHHPGYGVLTMGLNETTLEVTYNSITGPLDHWHYDVWSGAETEGDETFRNMKFLFGGDIEGNIAAVESTFEPRADPIVFEKRPPARLFDPEVLASFAGTYETVDESTVTVALSGGALGVTFPSSPNFALEPNLNGRFVLTDLRIISLEFVTGADGKVTKLLIHQPGSIDEAEPVE